MKTIDRQRTDLPALLEAYCDLLAEIDDWFAACLQAAPSETFACSAGCSACCRGLFDITLLDAVLLRRGLASLPAEVRAQVLAKCRVRLAELQAQWPQLQPPYLLNTLPDEDWMSMPEEDETPCPLLGDDNRCLVYAFRPMTCRLHGLPNIDLSGEEFSTDFCTLHAGSPYTLADSILLWPFRAAFERENNLLRALTQQLTGEPTCQADTFIPLALLAEND